MNRFLALGVVVLMAAAFLLTAPSSGVGASSSSSSDQVAVRRTFTATTVKASTATALPTAMATETPGPTATKQIKSTRVPTSTWLPTATLPATESTSAYPYCRGTSQMELVHQGVYRINPMTKYPYIRITLLAGSVGLSGTQPLYSWPRATDRYGDVKLEVISAQQMYFFGDLENVEMLCFHKGLPWLDYVTALNTTAESYFDTYYFGYFLNNGYFEPKWYYPGPGQVATWPYTE